jgi:hypothetical protein
MATLIQTLQNILANKDPSLAVDLLPMFESRPFIEAWLDSFHENFQVLLRGYVVEGRPELS